MLFPLTWTFIFLNYPFSHIWKDHHIRTNRCCLLRTCSSNGVSHHPLYWTETQRLAREWGSFIVNRERRHGQFTCDLIGSCWHREDENGVTSIRASFILWSIIDILISGVLFDLIFVCIAKWLPWMSSKNSSCCRIFSYYKNF